MPSDRSGDDTSHRTPAAPPRVWGRGLVAVSGRPFAQRVAGCYSARHLAAALAAERGRPLDAPARVRRGDRVGWGMSDAAAAAAYGLLVLLFGMPIAFTNVPSHALTQAMIVVLGFMLLVTDAGK